MHECVLRIENMIEERMSSPSQSVTTRPQQYAHLVPFSFTNSVGENVFYESTADVAFPFLGRA